METEEGLMVQSTEIAVSAIGSLVGFAIGGPIGAVVGGSTPPTVKLVSKIIKSWSDRRNFRIVSIVEKAFRKSGKSDDDILEELLLDSEWSDMMIKMIQQLMFTDPELDNLFSEIIASSIKATSQREKNRLIVLYDSIKGLNKVQIQIVKVIQKSGGVLSASSISEKVEVPEMELRNAVRDLELRGMIIDDGTEPTNWRLRELGLVMAKMLEDLEVRTDE